jgi:ATP adenylyltransferase
MGIDAEPETRGEDHLIGHGRHMTLKVVAKPFNCGEVVIVPKRAVPSITDLTDEELVEIGEWVTRVEAVMHRVYNPQGINVGMNMPGEHLADAAALAVHVVPRWTGDMNFMPVVAGIKVLPESLQRTLQVYRDALFS